MDILGIIPAKSKSYRFPGKNKRLFYGAASTLVEIVDYVIVASDDKTILNIAGELGCDTHERNEQEVDLNLPIVDVLKQVYLSQEAQYTHIICIFGCTINVTKKAIEAMIKRMKDNPELQEVRSFGAFGVENGMFMLTEKRLLEGHISSYIGAVTNNLKEIHREDQLWK